MWQTFAIESAPLADYVDFLWLSDLHIQSHAAELILPTGTVDLVIDLADRNAGRSVVSGVHSRALLLDTSGPLSLIGARFKPGAALALLGMPAGELYNRAVSPQEVWGHEAVRLIDRLHVTVPPLSRFQLLEGFLAGQLSGKPRRSEAVRYAVSRFHQTRRPASVKEVAQLGGMSAVRFSAAFRDEVGLTPRSYSKLLRFRRALDSIGPSAEVDWTSIALGCDYYDQAHFNHDFREFSGLTPSDYLLHRTQHLNHVVAATG